MTTPNQPQYAAPAPKPASGFYIKSADGLVAIGGLLVFVFSFAPLWSVPGADGFGGGHFNSWHMGTTVFTGLAGIVLAGTAFLDGVWQRDAARYGLHRHVVQLGVALYALVNMIGFAFGFEGLSFGWGGYLQLLGAIVAIVGAVLNHLGKLQSVVNLGGTSQAPQGYAPPQAYQPPAQGYPAPQPNQVDPQAPTQG